MRPLSVTVLSAMLTATPAWAFRTVPADKPITARLEVLQPLAITLPEEVVKVTTGTAVNQLSADHLGPHVFVQVTDPTVTGRLFIVGKSGALYTVNFAVATPADDRIEVVTKGDTKPKAQPFTLASFLRTLRNGRTDIPGLQAVEFPTPSVPDSRISLIQSTAIALGPTIGVVLQVRNTHTAPVVLDPRGEQEQGRSEERVALGLWVWPPKHTVRAMAVEDEFVAPDGQTRVYAVLERRP